MIELLNAPTTRELRRVVEDNTIEAKRKVYPPLVYVDWNETNTGRSIIYSGVFARFTPKTLLAVFNCLDLFESDSKARLIEIESQIKALYADMQNWTFEKANKAHLRQSSETSAQIFEGKIPEDCVLLTREQIHNDYTLKRKAIELAVIPLKTEAAQLARPIIEKSKGYIFEHMLALENDERQVADDYGVTYVPSYHWRALAKAVIAIDPNQVDREVYPSSMLAGILTF